MRVLALGALAGLVTIASADRLMNIPTGTKILFNRARAEFLWETSRPSNYSLAIGYGVTREIEAEFLVERFNRRDAVVTGDFSYNYVGALIDTLPGISFGVRDIADRTEDGRQFYLAVTHKLGAESDFNADVPLEATIGVGTGRRNPFFVGVRLPFTWQFRLLAEHDGNCPRLGLEYLPFRNVVTQIQFDDRRTALSLRLSHRF